MKAYLKTDCCSRKLIDKLETESLFNANSTPVSLSTGLCNDSSSNTDSSASEQKTNSNLLNNSAKGEVDAGGGKMNSIGNKTLRKRRLGVGSTASGANNKPLGAKQAKSINSYPRTRRDMAKVC